jgi:hypothetical protein
MFQPTSRLRDLCAGWCPRHGFQIGFIITANPRSLVGNMPNARVTDLTLACCGAVGMIVRGNYRSYDGELPNARMGDQFVGHYSGTIIEGDPRTLS